MNPDSAEGLPVEAMLASGKTGVLRMRPCEMVMYSVDLVQTLQQLASRNGRAQMLMVIIGVTCHAAMQG